MKTNTNHAKRILLTFFVLLIPLLASANIFSVNNIYYNITSDTGKQVEVTSSGGLIYSGHITIPATVIWGNEEYSVTSIGDNAFYGSNLKSITFPEGIISIGFQSFAQCHGLKEVIFPNNSQLTSIGNSAFTYCTSLQTITFPENSKLTSIESSAFWGCESLKGLILPRGVTSIGQSSFSRCSNLESITLPEGVTNIGSWAFSNCGRLRDITIPGYITSIENGTFSNCSSLEDITFPKSVASIGQTAFQGCVSLKSIILPTSMTSIGPGAFEGCISLAEIILNGSLTSIREMAFYNCTSLTSITCKAVTPPSIKYSDTFYGVDKSIPVYVPAASVEAYKSAEYWSDFSNIIGKEKCATPAISYNNGKVTLTCETEEAEIKTNIVAENEDEYIGDEFDLIPTYTLTTYATKSGYDNSDEVTLTLCWFPCTEEHEEGDETTNILTIPSKPVFIQCSDGVITLSGLTEGTEVAAYNTAGQELATAIATEGAATLTTGLEVGSTAVVKIGNNSIKIVIR